MPDRCRRSPALAAVFAALACSTAPAAAREHTRVEAFWVSAAGSDGRTGHTVPALLNLPGGWMAGDAAALVLSDGPWPGSSRERLVAALLEEGAAVLELDVNTARGISPERARAGTPPAPAELVIEVRDAVAALQRDATAGLVVALGHAAGGEAAMLAAAAARREPADGLAAGASLGPGPAAFALGGVPTEGDLGVHRGWPVRANRLCGVLAAAAVPSQTSAETDCRRALVGPDGARAVRVAGP